MKVAICIQCQREFPLNKDLKGLAPEAQDKVAIEFGWDYKPVGIEERRDDAITEVLKRGNLPVICEDCQWGGDLVDGGPAINM